MKKKRITLGATVLIIGFLLGIVNVSASYGEVGPHNIEQYENNYNKELVVNDDITPYAVAYPNTTLQRAYDFLIGKNKRNVMVGKEVKSVEEEDFTKEFGR